MRTRRERPCWLGAGNATCSACVQGFVLEVGFHCSGCDRLICAECALLDPVTGEVLCRACRASGEEAD